MYVVMAYDIPSDRRRAKMARAITPHKDRLWVYRLCAWCEDRIMIAGNDAIPEWEDGEFLIL